MKLSKLKHFIADIIEPRKKASVVSIIYNILMSLIVAVSCVFVFVDIFAAQDSPWVEVAKKVEIIAIIVFIAEYVLKLFVSEVLYEGQGWFKSKISYITSFDSFVDIICVLSIFLNQIPKEFAALRLLKLIKLSRLVKLKDAVDEIREKGDGTEEKKDETKSFRHRIFKIIYKDDEGDVLSKIYDIVSIVIIFLSVATIILDTFEFNETVTKVIFICEVVFTAFFAVEYVLRVWTADFEYPDVDKDHAKMKYIFSLLAIIDLLSILPIFFTFSPDAENTLPQAVAILKIFKILKIARLLKMSRYLNGINMFMQAIKEKKKQIFFSILILAFLAVISSILLYSFENMAGNEEFTDGFAGLKYAVATLTGFGEAEMEVTSTVGKVMVVIMIICGGCVVGVPLGIISEEFAGMVAKAADGEEEEEETKDLFQEFAEKLTPEQKMKIIAEYQSEIEQNDTEGDEE